MCPLSIIALPNAYNELLWFVLKSAPEQTLTKECKKTV